MEQLIANLSGSIRYETLRGRKYLVAPMSLITPGVLNGSKGALYYPPEEVAANADAWNHTPIVVYHPTQNGLAISARDPHILNSQGVGFVFGAKYNGKLVAEGWFDIEDTKRVDNRILESLESGKTIELSTGLFTENELAQDGAVFNGKPYTYIARNYRPDHLAILPDQTGACSVKDGCGVLVNQRGDKINFDLTDNELSHDELLTKLNKALKKRFTQDEPSVWVSDVYDSYIVYWSEDDLYKLSYTKSDSGVTLSSESPVKVFRETNIVVANKETPRMAKEKLVKELIANCSCWEDSDTEVLNQLEEPKLQKMVEAAKASKDAQLIANKAIEGFEDSDGGLHAFNQKTGKWEHAKKEKTAPVANKEEKEVKPQTDEEWLASAPAGIRAVVQNAMAAEAKRRNALYERIVANEETDEAKQALHQTLNLNAMSEEALEVLASRMEVKAAPQPKTSLPSYFGRSGGAIEQVTNKEKLEPLVVPTINWAETN